MIVLQEANGAADQFTAMLPDGRRWGPFEGRQAAAEWERHVSSRASDLVTAKEIHEGSVHGDGFHLIDPVALEMGLHPFQEVHDWLLEDDNGLVVADLAAGSVALDPGAAVLVDEPVRSAPARKIGKRRPPPPTVSLNGGSEAVIRSSRRGDIVIVSGAGEYIVAWRADERVRKDLPVLSLHTVRECASLAARKAAMDYEPPQRKKASRDRDYQVSLVYRWEHRIGARNQALPDMEGCRAFAAEICGAMGLPVPKVSLGRTSLENHSYFSGLRGVVVQRDMMDAHTVIHELAHYAVFMGRGPREAAHGPRFVGTLAGMLAAFAGADIENAIAAAEEGGVEMDKGLARKVSLLSLGAAGCGMRM